MHAKERLYTLDGLRGVAAIVVMLSHLEPSVRLAPGGYLAVDFFFGLSGVVIAQNYGDRLRAGLGWGRFVRLRLIRLYPMFVVGLALGLGRALAQVVLHQPGALPLGEIAAAFVLGLAMLPSVSSILPIYPLIGPGWSLLFEMIANGVYAARPTARAWGLSVICLLAAFGLWLVKREGQGLGMGGSWNELHVGLLRVAYSFTCGVLLYEGVLRRGRTRSSALALLPIALATVLMLVDVAPAWRGIYDWASIVALMPALVWLAARWNAPVRLRDPFEALGDISYPLYTTHYALIFAVAYCVRRLSVPPPVWVPMLVFGMCALSLFLARKVDAPARRQLARRFA